jgi:prolyl oligopeptidase
MTISADQRNDCSRDEGAASSGWITPPHSPIEPCSEVLHGVLVTDPYRWLEDPKSDATREWLTAQDRYTRSYLDAIPGRLNIQKRIRELLDVESYDSFQKVGERYFFRKHISGQEQFCIFLREGPYGEDQLLINPVSRGTGIHTSIKPIRFSSDGHFMLYEVKEGGERASVFELFDIENRVTLPDSLPHGHLRSFAFAPDSRSFYYVHEAIGDDRPHYRAVFRHILGASPIDDEEIFFAGEDRRLQLSIVEGEDHLGFHTSRAHDKTYTSFWLWALHGKDVPKLLLNNVEYKFGPLLLKDRILAITDCRSPNLRVVEIANRTGPDYQFIEVIPECDSKIRDWIVTSNRIFVSYTRGLRSEIVIFDSQGKRVGQLPAGDRDTVRLVGGSPENEELLLESESFTTPIQMYRYSPKNQLTPWKQKAIPYVFRDFDHTQVWFSGQDGTRIPMFLVGRAEVLTTGSHPTIMTSYGGFGIPMTPQFSVFVAFLIDRGCLFALPNIRGGSEFGAEWHDAAKGRHKQVAFDDFISASEWLVKTGRTRAQKLAIFGGSNSGLLVGAVLTQRPELFRAAVCMVPLLDMLRYHLFDNSHIWQDEFGTANDPEDFAVLARYSPYHRVEDGVAYPAAMIVSGDLDQTCNSLHARKMTARLQNANSSKYPILLDYSKFRGHSPVLPLTQRIEALTDRLAFLCDQLELHL